MRQPTATSRGKQKQSTSHGRGGLCWEVGQGQGHRWGCGNGKANGQSTSWDNLAWL